MNDNVWLHIHNCERCLCFKQKPKRDEVHLIESSYPMEIVQFNFLVIGSKKDINKEINVLVITDHFTRYVQAFITTLKTAHTVAITLYEKYFVHYGWPEKLHSDQAGNFKSNLIAELCKIAQVQKVHTVPYHPEGNAQCERFNQTLLGMIGSLNLSEKHRWQDWVSTLTHAYNCTRCDSTGFSPYYLMFGHVPHLPIDIKYDVT